MWSWPNHSIANINPNFPTPSHFSVSSSTFPPSSSSSTPQSHSPSSQHQSVSRLPFHSPGYQQPDYTNQSSSFGYQSSHGAWPAIPPHHVDSSPSSLLPPPPPPPSLPLPPPPPSSLHHQSQTEQFLSQKHHHDLSLNNSAPLHLATGGGMSLATGGMPMAGGDGRYHNSGSNIPFSVDFILQKSAAAGQEITSGYTMGGGVGVGGANIEQQYISDTPTGYGLDYRIEENKGHYDNSSLGVGVGGAYHRETRPQESIPSQSYDRPSEQYTEQLQAPPTYPIVNNEYNSSKCEERYSPPGLILKEDEGAARKDESLSLNQSSSSSSASVSSSGKINSVTPPNDGVPNESIPVPASPPKMADSGSSSSSGSSSEETSNKLTSNSFQLGLSPPPLSSNNQNVIPRVISDDNDNESFPMDTAKTGEPSVPPEQNGELENQPKSLSRPPPLVPVETPSQPKTGYYDDEDDDVFLPGPPTQKRLLMSEKSEKKEFIKTPSGQVQSGTSRQTESPTRNQMKRPQQQGWGRGKGGREKGGGESPGMVIGRRGRAAGRVLDENKLRIPLEKGWQRVVRARVAEGNNAPRVDICYVTPCNRRLRTFPEIHRYLSSNSITDLTIDHFTFSKKVNVGMIIDEKTSPESLDNLLVHPRRGRPPKRPVHSQQQQVKVHVDTVTDSEGSSRISLEPHEIIKPSPTKISSSVSTVTVPPTHSFLSHMSKDQHTITRIINTDYPDPNQPPRDETDNDSQNKDSSSLLLPQATPPLLASSNDWRPPPLTSPEEIVAGGWGSGATKGLTTIGSSGLTSGSRSHVITKRPRGRPKGSGLGAKPSGSLGQTSGHHVGGRKRKAKATVHILPSLTPGPVPPLTMGAPGINTGGTTALGTEPTGNTTGGATSSAPTLLKDQSKVSILKKQDEKEKKRQLIQANKARKRAESTHRATQRRMSQQSRRQRERALIKQAKERVERLNRQKEADWYQLRKSRIAKQREEANQLKARERTLKLVQEIQQREIENDRLMRLRQLEREKAEQLRRPTEDLLVNDLIDLPTLTKLKWVQLPAHSFADLVMVFEFSHSFDDFLEIEKVPRFSELYAGLFNVTIEKEEEEEGEEEEGGVDKRKRVNGLILLTMQLVKAAVHDGGSRTQTISGLPLRDVDVKEDTVSEVLRLYLQNKRNPFLKNVTTILSEYPYQSLSAVDKIVVLSYLVDELLSSVSLCREVDNRMEQIATLRRNKWKISLKLKRFRSRLTDSFGVSQFQKPVLYSGRGRPPKRALLNANGGIHEDGESSDDEGGANDPDDTTTAGAAADGVAPPTAPPIEEVFNSDEDSDEDIPAEKEDLQKRVKELKKKLIFVRGRINTLTRQMRKFPLGQDRYTRQYWNLPEMGGVLIEGQETANNDYLDELLPRLEAEEKEREEEEEKGRPLVPDSPPRSNVTAESHGTTSDVLLSSQSSPRPGGAWLTDSPAKYSDDTDLDTINTPTKSATPIKGSTPTPFPTIHEETSVDQFSVPPASPPKEAEPVSLQEKTQHPLEISTKHSHAQEQVAMETDPVPPVGSALPEVVDQSVPSAVSNSSPSIVTTFSSHKTTPPLSNTPVKSTTPSSTPLKATTSSVSLNTTPWFSLLPRKPCELLHYINGGAIGDIQGSTGLLNGGAGQMVVPGGYAAYVTQDGTTVLAATGQPMMQQVQVGYAVVGNTLVPQTQYIIQPGGGSSGTQYVSLPNGQIAALATGGETSTNATNIQYTNIGGNQYAIIQQPSVEEGVAGGVASATGNVMGGVNVESSGGATEGTGDGNTPQPRKRRRKRARDTIQQTTTAGGATLGSATATVGGGATATVGGVATADEGTSASLGATDSSEQKYITLALPTGTGGETQYCQVPADPRVLSGQYSYAIMPQGDGTSQIVLIENSTLGVGVTGGSEGKEVVEMEVPPATVFDNEYEGQPFKVDITLMYAEAPLPFNTKKESEVKKEEEKEKEKPLKELLEEVTNDLTNGWWTIRSPLEIDYLLRSLTMRGYREKGLHKLLQKNKDSICSTLKAGLLTTPPFENQEEKPEPQTKTTDSSPPEVIVVDKEGEVDEKMEETLSKRTESSNSIEEVESDDKEEAESQNKVVTELQDGNERVESQDDNDKEAEPKNEGDIDKEMASEKEEKMEEGLEAFSVSPTSFYPLETERLAEHILKYLKDMESRLFDAHLQIKGIIKANYQSQFMTSPSEEGGSYVTLPVIFNRLLMLESCVQRRYLKPPFKEKSHGSKKTETGGGREDKESSSPPPEPLALTKWKTSAVEATSSSQLAVCINQLERCIAWEKSPMKVFCVVCQTGDNESLLLLCDRCDRGTHTYCCRPKLDAIPDGDWFCHNCTVNASRKIACGVCQSSRGSLLHCTQCPNVFHKRCLNPPLTKLPSLPWVCIECRREQRRKPGRPRGAKDDLILCQSLLMDLEEQDDAWPFLEPVNRKKIPDYYRVIKKPMDFHTVKQKLREGKYPNKESLALDVRLIFDNCAFYNEDNSQIGLAGHNMRQYFEKRWTEMMLNQ